MDHIQKPREPTHPPTHAGEEQSRHVDVLIVNFRTGDLSAKAAAGVHGPGVHVYVWDNSGEMLTEPPAHAFMFGDGTNTWFAPANNRLAEQCNGEFLLLLNPDVELTYDGLSALVAAADRHPLAWSVAPRLLNPDGTDQDYLQRLPDASALLADRLPPLRRHGLRAAYSRFMAEDVDLRLEQVVEQPPAACLLVRRANAGVPLFDERYRLFFNDTDLARRQNLVGQCWLIPSITATHLRGESFRREKPRTGYAIAREYDRSLLTYARCNVRWWQVLVPIIVARLIASHLSDLVQGTRNGLGSQRPRRHR